MIFICRKVKGPTSKLVVLIDSDLSEQRRVREEKVGIKQK